MRIPFFSKKPAPKPKWTPRMLKVPDELVAEIRGLSDLCPQPSLNRVAHYNLWSRIAEIFPATAGGSWYLSFPTALQVYVVEREDRD